MTGPDARIAFGTYSGWYDAFNAGKDYGAEITYVAGAVERCGGATHRWLDMGCGTGRHLAVLHKRGINVEGLDASASMIEQGRRTHPHIPFHVGEAGQIRLAGNRDVVSMLFHVISYQVTDEAVRAAMTGAGAHLAPSGIFAFDFWHTDGVVHSPPVRRTRSADIEGRLMFRTSIPHAHNSRPRIDVRFEFRWDSPTAPVVHEELHRLRHFTAGEITQFLAQAGLTHVRCSGWLHDAPLSQHDWHGFICAHREQ